MRRTFYLDLDRTLFRTERVRELIEKVAELYPEKPTLKDGYSLRRNHYIYPFEAEGDTATYSHDLSWWLRDHDLEPQVVYEQLLATELADGRFEYGGVAELVGQLSEWGDVKILTFGPDEYQRFKAALCPSLVGLEVITILEQKSQYLNREARDGDWIVDDKSLDGLKPGIWAARVDHDGAAQVPEACVSLEEVGKYVAQKIDEKA